MGKFCGRSIKCASPILRGSLADRSKRGRAANLAHRVARKMRPSPTQEHIQCSSNPPPSIDEDDAERPAGPRHHRFRRDVARRAGAHRRPPRPVPRARRRRRADRRRARRQARGTHERYVREWLNAHAASGYVNYLADSGRYQLSPEQAMMFADEDSPAFIVGGFQTALAAGRIVDRLTDAFTSGAGIGWHEHDHDVFHGCARFYRVGLLRQPGAELDSGARRRRSQARGRHPRRRHGLRPRLLDHDHGEGISEIAVHGFDYHAGIDRRRDTGTRARPASRIAAASRSGGADYYPGAHLRLRHGVRRAARHGRSRCRFAARVTDAGARWHLDDRRALRRRSRRGESQPDRPCVLRGVDADVHALLACRRKVAWGSARRQAKRACGRW